MRSIKGARAAGSGPCRGLMNTAAALLAMGLTGFAVSCAWESGRLPERKEGPASGAVYGDPVWGKGTRIPAVFSNGTPARPDWIHKLNGFYQIRIDKFAKPQGGESFIAAATKRLGYVSDLGINGILLNPVAARGAQGKDPAFYNFYGVSEPEKLDPYLGTPDEFERFVRSAHERGIKVLLDVVPHGVAFGSPLLTAHPEWFKKDKDGKIIGTWGMADFDFTRAEVRDWWIGTMCEKWALRYDLDGFRCDCEPTVSGYDLWDKVRLRCEAAGHPVLVMSEGRSPARKMAYHIGQMDYAGDRFQGLDLAEEVRALEQSYYAVEISSHDYLKFTSEGRPVSFSALLSPFTPLWRMGDEFNAAVVYATGRTPFGLAVDKAWGICDQAGPQAEKGRFRRCARGGYLAQDFSVKGTTEVSVRVSAAGKFPSNRVRLTLFRSAASYKMSDTVKGKPLAQAAFTGFGDGEWLSLKLGALVHGHFLLRLDEAEGEVGIYGAEGSQYGGSFMSSDPKAVAKGFDMDLRATTFAQKYGEVLYFADLDWASLEEPAKARLRERVKRMIAVRKRYDYLLSPFCARMKDRNIVSVKSPVSDLQTYACFRGHQAIIVVGNDGPEAAAVRLSLPLAEMGLDGYSGYRVASLLNDGDDFPKPVEREALARFEVALKPWEVEAFLLEGVDGWNRLYGMAPDAGQAVSAGPSLSQTFSAAVPFSKLRIKAFGSAADGGLRVSIRADDETSAARSGGAPLASCDFPAFADSDWLELGFKQLPAGNYRWTAEALGSGAGPVGVWRTEGEGRGPLSSFAGGTLLSAGNLIAEWR